MPALRVKPSYYAPDYASPRGICACAVGLCAVLEWHGRCWILRRQWNRASSSYSTIMWLSWMF